MATRVRDLVREICAQHEVKIMKGHEDRGHLFLSIPPQVTISRLLQWLKGKTAHHLLAEFAHLKKQFWGRHLWARGYFCCSSGNVTDEIIAEYIANQNENQDEDFRVDGYLGLLFVNKVEKLCALTGNGPSCETLCRIAGKTSCWQHVVQPARSQFASAGLQAVLCPLLSSTPR
ncbi:MAG: IS200/IS605 family transposase [Acidobacteriaceae bacterium]